jgi:uncharacterized membrane protein YagU involved in acid resistance
MIIKLKKQCEDTFFRGAFCGTVAGIVKDLIDFGFHLLKVKGLFFWSFASAVAYGRVPKEIYLNLFGLILEIIFSGFLGVIFALVASKIKTRHYLLMGIFYGSMVWFLIRATIVCYQISPLDNPSPPVRPLLTWTLSMLFGMILAWLDRRFSPKTS